MKQAAFRITLGGRDLTNAVMPRLMSLTLTESREGTADQLDITLDDADGQLAIPPRGEQIQLELGWKNNALISKGTFIVDEVEHAGTPDQLILRARTADMLATFLELKERSFHETTVGSIIQVMAFENQLANGCAAGLSFMPIKHLDQTRESDANFLRRLGKQFDAIATVKNETLIFVPASECKSASGKDIPQIQITRTKGDRHRYHAADRDSYSGVRAYWYDTKRTARKSVVAGVAGNAKRLRTTFSTEADALRAARSEWARIQRGVATFELELAEGIPEAGPQTPVIVQGFKPEIDATEWVIPRISHSYTPSNGLTSRIELETKMEPADETDELTGSVDPDEGITGVVANWLDKVSKKSGQERIGKRGTDKTLQQTYASKYSARRAVQLEWSKITDRREAIAEQLK